MLQYLSAVHALTLQLPCMLMKLELEETVVQQVAKQLSVCQSICRLTGEKRRYVTCIRPQKGDGRRRNGDLISAA